MKVSGLRLIFPTVLCVTVMLAQDTVNWKEYSFPEDQFAITFPTPPSPHPDSELPNTTTYTAGGVSVRATRADAGCDWAIDKLFQHAGDVLAGKSAPESGKTLLSASVRNGTEAGHRYMEFAEKSSSNAIHFERYVCGSGKMYAITAAWRDSVAMPSEIEKIVRSFHLIQK